MASDSQTTSPIMKSFDAVKMAEADHSFGKALIAGAGAVLSSEKAMGHFVSLAKTNTQDKKPLADLLSIAIKKTRDEFRYQQFDCTSEEFQAFLTREELHVSERLKPASS